MVNREEYDWTMLCKDLALMSTLTMMQAHDAVWPLEAAAQEDNNAVTHPYDLLRPLVALFTARDDSKAVGEAVRQLVLRIPDERSLVPYEK